MSVSAAPRDTTQLTYDYAEKVIKMCIKVCQAKFCNVSIVSNRGFNFCILFHDTNGSGRKVSEVSCSWAMDHIHFSVIKVA